MLLRKSFSLSRGARSCLRAQDAQQGERECFPVMVSVDRIFETSNWVCYIVTKEHLPGDGK